MQCYLSHSLSRDAHTGASVVGNSDTCSPLSKHTFREQTLSISPGTLRGSFVNWLDNQGGATWLILTNFDYD